MNQRIQNWLEMRKSTALRVGLVETDSIDLNQMDDRFFKKNHLNCYQINSREQQRQYPPEKIVENFSTKKKKGKKEKNRQIKTMDIFVQIQ